MPILVRFSRSRAISFFFSASCALMSRIIFSSPSRRRLALRNCATALCSEAILTLFSCNSRSMAAISLLISSTGRRPPSASPATEIRFSRVLISARFSEIELMSSKTALISESFALTTTESESRCSSTLTTVPLLTHDARASAAPSAMTITCFITF